VEAWEVRTFGASVLSLVFRTPVVVLETQGRRSGRRRRTTLAWMEVDGRLLVVGGAAGQHRVPDWVANVRADPKVAVMRRRRRSDATMRELADGERATVWPAIVARWPRVARYEHRAGRAVPVFEVVVR
jgi:deazaflavin-dependent oxidoreductase (nitroreductase family)